MRTLPVLLTLLLFLAAPAAKAHRLNEYLQATKISLSKDSARLHISLTAGTDVAAQLLTALDADGDGSISDKEQQAYVRLMLQGISVNIDGRDVPPQLVSYHFPAVEEIRKGLGDIQLNLSVGWPPVKAEHHLVFEHHAQQATTAYLVNCLLPEDSSIRITGQSRSNDQSLYRLDFTMADLAHATPADGRSVIEKTNNRAAIKTYFVRGLRHILTGYDHLLFLCALVLGATSIWNLVKLVTVFTIAHSITLTLASFGLVHVPAAIIEPFIAASIVFVAVQNIVRPQSTNGTGRLALAFFSGLFHGLGFAGGLLDLMHALPPHLVLYAILGFSLGIEAGNQLVLLPLYAILQGVKRYQAKVRKLNPSPTFQQIVSGVVALAGLYYFLIAIAGHL